jgi:hypothetical protein
LDAQGAVDWAKARMPALRDQIEAWRSDEAYRLIVEPRPEIGRKLIRLRRAKPVPAVLNAEVGAIVGSVRVALDLLTTGIAGRAGATDAERLYFPIASSAADWREARDQAVVGALPPAVAETIERLKPYRGGNDTLYALHRLDGMRRRRRLIDVRLILSPDLQSVGLEYPDAWPGFADEAVIAWTGLDWCNDEIPMILDIAFEQPELRASQPVIPVLWQFIYTVEGVIALFDA